jgi:hypothetical protein
MSDAVVISSLHFFMADSYGATEYALQHFKHCHNEVLTWERIQAN